MWEQKFALNGNGNICEKIPKNPVMIVIGTLEICAGTKSGMSSSSELILEPGMNKRFG